MWMVGKGSDLIVGRGINQQTSVDSLELGSTWINGVKKKFSRVKIVGEEAQCGNQLQALGLLSSPHCSHMHRMRCD